MISKPDGNGRQRENKHKTTNKINNNYTIIIIIIITGNINTFSCSVVIPPTATPAAANAITTVLSLRTPRSD